MRKTTYAPYFFLIFLLCLVGCTSTQETFDQLPYQIDPLKQNSSKRMIFRMSINNDSLGYSKLDYTVSEDSILIIEDTKVLVDGTVLEEKIVTVLNVDYSVRYNEITGSYSGFPINVVYNWVDNQIIGFSKFPDHPNVPVVNVDTVAGKHFERMTSVLFFPLLLPDYDGFSTSYSQFNTQSGGFNSIHLEAKSNQIFDSGSATYENVNMVNLSGGEAEQIIYLTDTQPRKIVGIRFKEIPWEYDLVESD